MRTSIKRVDYSGGALFPGAGKSITGWTFIICGAVIGFVGFFSIYVLSTSNVPHRGICLIPAIAGGWAGMLLHKKFKNRLH